MSKIKVDKKIGLALGSGGARGLAHIGVLKVLIRNKIPIDCISGSSIGAMIGALYAVSTNVAEIEHIATTADWKLFLSLLDPGTSKGLFRGDKIRKFLIRFIGDMEFKDLKIPLTISATNFSTGEQVVLDKGNLLEAIMASISVPLIFQPVKMNGQSLVDGGLSMPVPITPLKKNGATSVIAVNLDGDYFSHKKSRLNTGETALQTIKLLRYHLADRDSKDADIIIVPEVGEIRDFNFFSSDKSIKAGEKATRKVLPKIKELLK